MEELEIHGLGAAINQAINIALQLEVRGKGSLKVSFIIIIININIQLQLTAFFGDWFEFWGVKRSSFAIYNQGWNTILLFTADIVQSAIRYRCFLTNPPGSAQNATLHLTISISTPNDVPF